MGGAVFNFLGVYSKIRCMRTCRFRCTAGPPKYKNHWFFRLSAHLGSRHASKYACPVHLNLSWAVKKTKNGGGSFLQKWPPPFFQKMRPPPARKCSPTKWGSGKIARPSSGGKKKLFPHQVGERQNWSPTIWGKGKNASLPGGGKKKLLPTMWRAEKIAPPPCGEGKSCSPAK